MTQTIKRKGIRPVDRERMKPWLTKLLDDKSVNGLRWIDRKKKIFEVKWRHGSRHGWCRNDADVFERWARHTGKFNEGETPNPKKWKANFRCALNSLPDIKEIKEQSVTKGSNAFRVYQMCDRPQKKKKKDTTRKMTIELEKYEKMSLESDGEESRLSTAYESPESLSSSPPYEPVSSNVIPDFTQITDDRSIQRSGLMTLSSSGGGGIVKVQEEVPSPEIIPWALENPCHSPSSDSSVVSSYIDISESEFSETSFEPFTMTDDEKSLWTDIDLIEDGIIQDDGTEPVVVIITNEQGEIDIPTAMKVLE